MKDRVRAMSEKSFSDSQTSADRPKGRAGELISGCRNRVVKVLLSAISPIFDATGESLYQAAESGKAPQDKVFESLKILKNEKTGFTERLSEALIAGFVAPKQAKAAENEVDYDEMSLSLVDDSDLEESLAIGDMIAKAEIHCTQEIYALNQRLSVLYRQQRISNDNNPCGPSVIGHVFQTLTHDLPLHLSHKVLLLREFDRYMQPRLSDLLKDINAFLIDEGILPNLKVSVTKPKADQSRQPTSTPDDGQAISDQAAPEDNQPQLQTAAQSAMPLRGAQPTRPVPKPVMPAAQDFFERARAQTNGNATSDPAQLAQSFRSAVREHISSEDRYAPAGAVAAQPQIVEQSLAQLQQQYANMAASELAALSAADIRKALGRTLGVDPETGAPRMVPAEQAQSLEMIGMVFEQVEKETQSSPQVGRLLKRLQLPLMQAVARDDSLLENPEHPARQFFNTVSDASELWIDERGAESPMFQKIDSAVASVLANYDGDLAVFEELIGKIEKHIALLSRRATLAEKRHVEAVQGRSRLEDARRDAHEAVDMLIEKFDPPAFVGKMLGSSWIDVLALIHLQEGTDNDRWVESVSAAKILAASVSQAVSPNNYEKIRKKLPRVLDTIDAGLRQVGYGESEIEDLMRDIESCHRFSLGREEKSVDAPEQAPEPMQQKTSQLPEAEKPKKMPPAQQRKEETLDEAQKLALAQIKLMSFGTWLEIQFEEDGPWQRRKLSWFSPISGHVLFVNNRGAVAEEITLNQLARLKTAGRWRKYVHKRKPLFDRAVHAIVERFQSWTGKVAPA